MCSKELPSEVNDRILFMHRSGKGYKNISATLEVPKKTLAFITIINEAWNYLLSEKTDQSFGKNVKAT